MITRFDELLGRPVSMRALALVRILTGPAVLWHLEPYLSETLDGETYQDAFHEPYASWYPDLPESLYVGLLWVGVVAAVAMSLGLCTRVSTMATFGIVAYNLFLSTTHFRHNAAYLVIVLAVLAIVSCGSELSLDAWIRRRRRLPPLDPSAPGWPLWVLRFECATVYAASGLSKLLDGDWFGGTVTWQRTVRIREDLEAASLPDWLISILTDRDFHTGAAKVIVLVELFIALGFWWRRSRYLTVWVAAGLHMSIEVLAEVQTFSYLGIVVLLIWAVPSPRDRVLRVDPADPRHRRLLRAVGALDWLARFRVEPGTPGSGVEVVDRDGTVVSGAPAVAVVLSRLPLTTWFALPVLLLPAVRRARRTPGRSAGAHDDRAGGLVV